MTATTRTAGSPAHRRARVRGAANPVLGDLVANPRAGEPASSRIGGLAIPEGEGRRGAPRLSAAVVSDPPYEDRPAPSQPRREVFRESTPVLRGSGPKTPRSPEVPVWPQEGGPSRIPSPSGREAKPPRARTLREQSAGARTASPVRGSGQEHPLGRRPDGSLLEGYGRPAPTGSPRTHSRPGPAPFPSRRANCRLEAPCFRLRGCRSTIHRLPASHRFARGRSANLPVAGRNAPSRTWLRRPGRRTGPRPTRAHPMGFPPPISEP